MMVPIYLMINTSRDNTEYEMSERTFKTLIKRQENIKENDRGNWVKLRVQWKDMTIREDDIRKDLLGGEVVVVRGCDSRGGGCRGVRGDDGVNGVVVEMMMVRLVVCEVVRVARMTKVIKGEFEKIKDVKVEDVPLTCDASLEVFNDEIRGDNEVELTDEESSDNDDEIAEVFRINTNIFDYETPLCSAFNEFNYLLKFMGRWRRNMDDADFGPKSHTVKHPCKPFNYKTRCLEWPTCSWKDDGYCNGGNLPEAYIIGKPTPLSGLRVVCNIKRYMMIKYSFNDDEEYVVVKEDEYDDLTVTRKEACQAYQEIFRIMDEGWMVTRAK
ncbi:hypothetical protein Tco_0672321 [Tanacetum coccineum]